MEQFDAIIIGAGPSGMMAAIRAAERNKKILLVERNDSPGRKLLISGNGRCNLTNSCDIEEFLGQFSQSRAFLRNAFAIFFNTELISFFQDAGLKLKTEEGGRVFPQSDSSRDVLDVLKSKLKNRNIKIIFGERLRDINVKDKKIEGVLTYSGKHFPAARIAISTGGMSYPKTGSTGDGYIIAKKLGHEILPLKPGLAPVFIKEGFIKDWQGISLESVRLALFAGAKKIDQRRGDLMFTHFGLSGPVALDMSGSIYDTLKLKNEVNVSINFKPDLEYENLDTELLREFKASPNKSIKNISKNFLPQGIIRRFLEYCSVNLDKNANQITSEERRKLINGLFGLRLTVKDVMPINNSMATRGGVNTKEINPKTMESKLVRGLFFAGEVIDIDARTGGYNMQAAFSTGWVCGDNI